MNQEPPDTDLERMLRDYFAESEQRPPDFERFWIKLDTALDAEPAAGIEASLMMEQAQGAARVANGAAPEPFALADGEGYDFVLNDTLEDSMSNGHDQSGRQPSTTEPSNRWDTSRRGFSARATAIAAIAAALILAVIAATIYTQFATRRTPHPTATETAGPFTKFALPDASSRAIAVLEPTPDGGLWFADLSAVRAKISRLNPDGSLTEFPIPTADKVTAVYMYGLVVAPDGNLWFSGDEVVNGSAFTPFLKRMTPDGTITALPLPAGPHVTKLVNGPDGTLWFIAYENRSLSSSSNPIVNEIGRITMDGHITVFPSPSEDNLGSILDICVGPDQAIWYTWTSASSDPANLKGRIGRMSLTGQAQEFAAPYPPELLTSGKDGALWYSELASTGIVGDSKTARKGFIGRITTAGAASEIPIDPNTSALEIAAGSDGGIWYIVREGDGRTLNRVTANGGIKSFTAPATPPFHSIVAGSGVLWIVDATNTLWRFNLPK